MIDYINELISSDSLYWFCALTGSGMFLIQFIIALFGMSDQGGDASSEGGKDTLDVRKFKWLSIQTVIGFLMMFGWTALTCRHEFELPEWATVGVSLTAGLFTALILSSIFHLSKKLVSTGSRYQIEDAIGKEGYLYQSIPKGGRGKVSISLQNFTHEIDAISHHTEELPSFTRVKIIEKSDERTVVVVQI